MTRRQFSPDIRSAILAACEAAAILYGANFTVDDTGAPTASLGRLSAGITTPGVWDDLIVGSKGTSTRFTTTAGTSWRYATPLTTYGAHSGTP